MKKISIAGLVLFFLAGGFAFAKHHGKGHGGREKGDHMGKGPGMHMMDMMKKMDADNDKKVTKAEWDKHHAERFTEMDANKDGAITKEEFEQHMKSMMEKMKEDRKGGKGPKGKGGKMEDDDEEDGPEDN